MGAKLDKLNATDTDITVSTFNPPANATFDVLGIIQEFALENQIKLAYFKEAVELRSMTEQDLYNVMICHCNCYLRKQCKRAGGTAVYGANYSFFGYNDSTSRKKQVRLAVVGTCIRIRRQPNMAAMQRNMIARLGTNPSAPTADQEAQNEGNEAAAAPPAYGATDDAKDNGQKKETYQ